MIAPGRLLLTSSVCLLLAACASQQPSKQVLIQGIWTAEFEGQAVTLEYSVSEVTVLDFGISFPYEWVDDDHIRLNAMGQQVVSAIEFESPDEMHQITDGDVQVLYRQR
ncbi:MAG: hypothetical protein VYE29_10120 [Pseudomonadota bacterium]|nr:hypothetical protein [Pseudohongiella sp.]MEC8860341.1 hypothetical protein [Pseudomonadota bacterium]|tara:strand:- start:563 stop:889 length:327 start_codon:yes stop_codon:yes gene_type:complete